MLDISDGKKPCARCKVRKPLSDFKKDTRAKHGVASYCRECAYAINKAKRQTPEYKKRNKIYARRCYDKARNKTRGGIELNDPGFIYVLHMNGVYKIGKSTNVKSRYIAIAGSMPQRVELIHSFPTSAMSITEWELHQRFHQSRLNGEWFTLSTEEIEYLKNL